MKNTARAKLRLVLDPAEIMRAAGRKPDPWQKDLLRSIGGTSSRERILLLCSRQVGKTETVAAYAAWRAIVRRGAVVVCLAPTQRQSTEMLLRVRGYLHAAAPLIGPLKREAITSVELRNGSRVLALPASASGIRGVSATDLLFDEAGYQDDGVWEAARPMIAATKGNVVALTTANGKQGWFHEQWISTSDDLRWRKWEIPYHECPRLDREFVEKEERASLPRARWEAEYMCRFLDAAGQAIPEELIGRMFARKPAGADTAEPDPFKPKQRLLRPRRRETADQGAV